MTHKPTMIKKSDITSLVGKILGEDVDTDFSEEEQLDLVRAGPTNIRHFDNPSEEVQLEAVKIDPRAILYIENPTEKVQLAVVKSINFLIKDIKNPTEKVQLAAVKQNGELIKYIKNPSEKIQLEVVKTKGDYIYYIHNPSEKVKMEAVKNDPWAIEHIDNPSEKVQLEAIKYKMDSFLAIENPSKKVQLYMIENGLTKHIHNIIYKFNPSEEMLLKIIKRSWEFIEPIKNPSEEVQMEAVKQFPDSIELIKNPTEKVQMEAIKQNPLLFPGLKNPAEKVIRYVSKKEKWNLPIHKKQYLPPHLSSDQLTVLRYMDKNSLTEISVRELKKNFVNTPIIQDLTKLKKGKNLSRQDILNFKPEDEINKEDLFSIIKKNYMIERGSNWTDMQRLFKSKTNRVFLLTVKPNLIIDQIDDEFKDITEDYIVNSNHPMSPKKNLVIGWVRYTIFDKDIWIDEIQSDLMDDYILGPRASELKKIPDFILKEFIRTVRKRGFQKIYMPTHKIKTKFYHANPPMSLYKDVPKKARFKLGDLEDTKFSDELQDSVGKMLNKEKVWISANMASKLDIKLLVSKILGDNNG